MRSTRSSGPVALRRLNRGTILDILRSTRPMSRTGLSRKAHLSKPTISVIVEELLALDLVREIGLGESRRGRRPVMLMFNPDARLAIGAEFGGQDWTIVLTNLDGEIVRRHTRTAPSSDPESVADALAEGVHEICGQADLDQVLGVGIGIPGIVSVETGVVLLSVNLDWADVPLKQLVEERIQLPVAVTNRCKAAALAEKWHGAGRAINDLIYIRIGTGIGAGFVHRGELLWSSSYAGELGHCCIDPEGPLCICGKRGCVQALVSGPALADRARQRIQEGAISLLADMSEGQPERITAIMVEHAAREGDALAREILAEMGKWLGVSAGTLINLYHPQMIVLGGPVSQAGPFFIDSLRAEAQLRSLEILAQDVQFVFSTLGRDAGPIGAATVVSRQINSLLDWSKARPVPA